jgi:salicylate hydroxylase
MTAHFLIAGAGIGGLGAALALARMGGDFGVKVTVLEQADAFSELGAGIQISPNAYQVLASWGLGEELKKAANFPEKLQVRSAASDKLLGQLTMGKAAQTRYGFPFATIRRADLHALLLNAVRQLANVDLHLNAKIVNIVEANQQVTVTTGAGESFTADVLVGADGLRSRIRQHAFDEATPTSSPSYTGHTAWRALLPMNEVPTELQQDKVTAWLAPDSHTIAYPVQQGKSLNIVYCRENRGEIDLQPAYLLPEMLSKVLQNTFQTATNHNAWTRWDLFDRPPLTSSEGMFHAAHPHIALLGDAAHPMLPYLAQGAAMALEDAQALAASFLTLLQQDNKNYPAALRYYAQERWQRNAYVQARAARNGRIFHAKPPVSWARDAAMGLLGAKIMDAPWLYSYVYGKQYHVTL